MAQNNLPSPSNGAFHDDSALPTTALTVSSPAASPAPASIPEFFQDPQIVLERAEKVAKALKSFLDRKPDKVEFNGKRYPQAEDWQFVGAFFGHTARVRSTEAVMSMSEDNLIDGYIAVAEVVDASGRVVSAAEAACTRGENNWARKPDFQLRSMAQTRACAKSLRNVFAWVMILAGLAPTPAEEMDSDTLEDSGSGVELPRRKSAQSAQSAQTAPAEPDTITVKQQKRLFAIAADLGVDKDAVREILNRFGFEFSREITRAKYPAICAQIEKAA